MFLLDFSVASVTGHSCLMDIFLSLLPGTLFWSCVPAHLFIASHPTILEFWGKKIPNILLKTQEAQRRGWTDGMGVRGVRAKPEPLGKGPVQTAPKSPALTQETHPSEPGTQMKLTRFAHSSLTWFAHLSCKKTVPLFCFSNFSFFSKIANAKGANR